MPLIYNSETGSDRGNQIVICKTSAHDQHDKPKLYAANRSPLTQQADFVNHFTSKNFISPCLMAYAMGSGKSLTSLLCALQLFEMGIKRPKVIILCDLSIIGQWATAVRSLHAPAGICFTIMGYNQFEKSLNEEDFERNCRRADLMIVDESQIFRNLSDRMRDMVDAIRLCPRVLLLSGTPIMNSAEDATGFKYLCTGRTDVSLAAASKGRVVSYDPALMKHSKAHYPTVVREVVHVSMTWAQTLMYFGQRSNTFKLVLPGNEGALQVQRVVSNRYSMAVQSMANLPFPEHPERSPKLMALVNTVIKLSSGGPQVVYSSRVEKGVTVIQKLIQKMMPQLKVVKIDGAVPAADRAKIVKAYNAGSVDVLILSPASARGVDLMRTYAFHLFEPHQNIAEESQTLTRAVRYDSHKGMADPKVRVFQYLAVFPKDKPAKSDTDLMMQQAAHIFGPDQIEGLSVAAMIGALKLEIKKEKWSVDEIQSTRNTQKHIEVSQCLSIIRGASIPMPLTAAAGVPKAKKQIKATVGKVRNQIEDYQAFAEGEWHQGQLKMTVAKSKQLITDAVRTVTAQEEFMLGQDFKQLVLKEVVRVLRKNSSKKQR